MTCINCYVSSFQFYHHSEIISTIDRQQQHSPTGSGNSALSPGSAASTDHGPPEVSSTTPAVTADGEQSGDESDNDSENSDPESAALQRSVVDGSGDPHHHHHHGDVDSFDHVLQTTSHHEAVYAYYYLDENHKVRVIVIVFEFVRVGEVIFKRDQ